MSSRKFLIFICFVLAIAVFAWASGDALAQTNSHREKAKEEVKKDVTAKGKATVDDQAKFFGKITPTEQKAAAKRNRQLGLQPGIAGRSVQAPSSGESR